MAVLTEVKTSKVINLITMFGLVNLTILLFVSGKPKKNTVSVKKKLNLRIRCLSKTLYHGKFPYIDDPLRSNGAEL